MLLLGLYILSTALTALLCVNLAQTFIVIGDNPVTSYNLAVCLFIFTVFVSINTLKYRVIPYVLDKNNLNSLMLKAKIANAKFFVMLIKLQGYSYHRYEDWLLFYLRSFLIFATHCSPIILAAFAFKDGMILKFLALFFTILLFVESSNADDRTLRTVRHASNIIVLIACSLLFIFHLYQSLYFAVVAEVCVVLYRFRLRNNPFYYIFSSNYGRVSDRFLNLRPNRIERLLPDDIRLHLLELARRTNANYDEGFQGDDSDENFQLMQEIDDPVQDDVQEIDDPVQDDGFQIMKQEVYAVFQADDSFEQMRQEYGIPAQNDGHEQMRQEIVVHDDDNNLQLMGQEIVVAGQDNDEIELMREEIAAAAEDGDENELINQEYDNPNQEEKEIAAAAEGGDENELKKQEYDNPNLEEKEIAAAFEGGDENELKKQEYGNPNQEGKEDIFQFAVASKCINKGFASTSEESLRFKSEFCELSYSALGEKDCQHSESQLKELSDINEISAKDTDTDNSTSQISNQEGAVNEIDLRFIYSLD